VGLLAAKSAKTESADVEEAIAIGKIFKDKKLVKHEITHGFTMHAKTVKLVKAKTQNKSSEQKTRRACARESLSSPESNASTGLTE